MWVQLHYIYRKKGYAYTRLRQKEKLNKMQLFVSVAMWGKWIRG